MNSLLIFPCYEPAGSRLELSEGELLQHMLVIGTTGCGKSTLLTAATRQLIRNPHQPGLLILDAKNDGIVEQVRGDAKKAGREKDVIVFGPGGDAGLDLFGQLTSFDHVESLTRRLMLGTELFGNENAYWHQASAGMINAALTLLAGSPPAVTYETAVEFMRSWFLSAQPPEHVRARISEMRGRNRHHLLAATAMDQVRLWETLDPRTKSNLQSCLLNILRPLLSPLAENCLGGKNRPCLSPGLAATNGKLCVVSVPALTEPDLARFIFRLAKQEFFDAVQRRQGNTHCLTGLVADELPLVITREDVEQLATVRSKRCFVLAATQGLDGVTQKLGTVGGRALVNNFNTIVFMRSREAETSVFAFIALGNRKLKIRPPKGNDDGQLGLLPVPVNLEVDTPVCPIGTLARLAPHQAFVLSADDGRRTLEPLWLVPWFEWEPTPPAPDEPKGGVCSYYTARHVEQLMLRAGFKRRYAATTIIAATKTTRRRSRKKLLEAARHFFRVWCVTMPEGLDNLPNPWLAALPGLLFKTRKPHWEVLPYFIKHVGVQDGMLLLQFAQEQPNPEGRLTAWDKLRIAINAGLYPSCWRELKPKHLVQLGLPAHKLDLGL